LNKKDKEALEKLSKLHGREFDGHYVKTMVADDVGDIASFDEEAHQGQDPDVRAFANKALPTLRDHLQRARVLSDRAR